MRCDLFDFRDGNLNADNKKVNSDMMQINKKALIETVIQFWAKCCPWC